MKLLAMGGVKLLVMPGRGETPGYGKGETPAMVVAFKLFPSYRALCFL